MAKPASSIEEVVCALRACHRLPALFTLVIAAAAGTAHAQSPFCDPSLPVPKGDPLAYRQRGDRCEGRYIRQVGATTLTVASFVESFAPLSREPHRSLILTWSEPRGATVVRVRAQGIKRRLYYRMDTRQAGGRMSFEWPTELLTVIVEKSDDIGIVASARVPVGTTEREVLLPLRAGYTGGLASATGYRALILPGVQLSEVFVTVRRINAQGEPLAPVRNNAPLQYGYYPAARAIEIPIQLAELAGAGIYRMDLTARLDGGGTASTELYFFHPGSIR
jgi:hypothetical protein